MVRLYTGAESIIQAPMTTSAANDGQAITDTRYTYDAQGRLHEVKVYERQDTPIAGGRKRRSMDTISWAE